MIYKIYDYTPEEVTFFIRVFETFKDMIELEYLSDKDKESYQGCCRILNEYKSALNKVM